MQVYIDSLCGYFLLPVNLEKIRAATEKGQNIYRWKDNFTEMFISFRKYFDFKILCVCFIAKWLKFRPIWFLEKFQTFSLRIWTGYLCF